LVASPFGEGATVGDGLAEGDAEGVTLEPEKADGSEDAEGLAVAHGRADGSAHGLGLGTGLCEGTGFWFLITNSLGVFNPNSHIRNTAAMMITGKATAIFCTVGRPPAFFTNHK